eukprot:689081-Prymnesium_polylepis.1
MRVAVCVCGSVAQLTSLPAAAPISDGSADAYGAPAAFGADGGAAGDGGAPCARAGGGLARIESSGRMGSQRMGSCGGS